MSHGARVAAVGILTGWGEGPEALPLDAGLAAGERRVIPLTLPGLVPERLRRATRECRLGIAAVEAVLHRAGLERETIAGARTALLYATAGAYAASNRAFIEASVPGGALHFPYTAPSATPAEVAIEFRLTGAYVILIGGATATVDALWQASTLIAKGAADRALVLAVETFEECADLYRRARWLVGRPLTEAAACALVVAAADAPVYRPSVGTRREHADEDAVRRRAGETLACAPLIALALAGQTEEPAAVSGRWRNRRATIAWPAAATARNG